MKTPRFEDESRRFVMTGRRDLRKPAVDEVRLVFVFGLSDDRFVRTVVFRKKDVSPEDVDQSLERR